MVFSSTLFLFIFLPLVLLIYYLIPQKYVMAKNIELLIASLLFYAWGERIYVGLMIISICVNYIFGLLLEIFEKRKWRLTVLVISIVFNLGLLFFFKYINFFTNNAFPSIVLPIGISFFTFQALSYVVDVYRGTTKVDNLFNVGLYISFFPQLIAGPIVTHDEMLPQFKDIGTKRFDDDTFCRGLFIFILGMGKKVLIADTFGVAVDTGYGMLGEIGSMDAVLIMLFYTLQLYFDFSGYCDMAIGIGKMMGIEITINFNSPYKACNIIDFWKRWHITLSRFFTKNIYIPLGGNRKGNARMYANLFFVFFLSGLWHGAGWNYILWGVMHGVLYCVTRWVQRHAKARIAENVSGGTEAEDNVYPGQREAQSIFNKTGRIIIHACKVLVTFLYVNAAWVFFRSESIGQAVELFKRMFTGGIAIPSVTIAEAFNLDEFWYVLKVLHLTDFTYSKYILMVAFTIVILLATFFGKNVQEIAKTWKMSWISAIVIAVVFVWCVVSLSGVSTFLYFNF